MPISPQMPEGKFIARLDAILDLTKQELVNPAHPAYRAIRWLNIASAIVVLTGAIIIACAGVDHFFTLQRRDVQAAFACGYLRAHTPALPAACDHVKNQSPWNVR